MVGGSITSTYLDNVEAQLANYRNARGVGAEATKAVSRLDLIRAEIELETYLAQGSVDSRALLAHAQLASLLEDWEQAIVRWGRVLRSIPESRNRAYHNLAVAYRNIGSFSRAHLSIKRISRGFRSEAIAVERQKLEARESEEVALRLGNRAVKSVLTRDDRSARQLTEAALSVRTDGQHAKECIRRVVADVTGRRAITNKLRRIASASRFGLVTPDGRSRGSSTAPRCVFFAGFGWSGSGALFDYFSQSSVATLPFGRAELAAFSRESGAKSLIARTPRVPGTLREHLLRFILCPVLGLGAPQDAHPDKYLRQTLLRAVKPVGDEGLELLATACSNLCHQLLERHACSAKDVEDALRGFFDLVLDSATSPKQVALTSNSVPAAEAGLVRLVSGAKAVAVMRDPRDQYASQMLEFKGRMNVTCDSFIRKLDGRLKKFGAAQAEAPDGTIELVRFEDFILDAVERERIGEVIGIPVDSLQDGELEYRPENSSKNIGIFRSYPDQSEIKRIADAFPDLLFER